MSKINNYLIIVSSTILLITFLGCKQNEVEYVIEEEVMVKILMDIHIAEAAAQQGVISQRDSLRNLYYNQIFELHSVSKEKYEEDMELLKRDAPRLSNIYDKVIDQLKERKEKL